MFYRWNITVKIVQIVVVLFVAVLMVWRAHTYNDPTSATSLVPAVMCASFSALLCLTAVTMALGDNEQDADVV